MGIETPRSNNKPKIEVGENDIENDSESEKTAEAKLATLTREGFRDYAIRFANIDEYEQIIANGGWQENKEAFVPKFIRDEYGSREQLSSPSLEEFKEIRDYDFNDYLKNKGVGDWLTTIIYQTQAPSSASSLASNERVIKMLNQRRKGVLKEREENNDLNIRQETLRRFREFIINWSGSERAEEYYRKFGIDHNSVHDKVWDEVVGPIKKINELAAKLINSNDDISTVIQDFINKIKSSQGLDDAKLKELYQQNKDHQQSSDVAQNLSELISLINELLGQGPSREIGGKPRKTISNDDLATLFDFCQNENWGQSDGDLRKIVEVLSRNGWAIDNQEQYNLVIVYSTDVVGNSTYNQSWRKLTSPKDDPKKKSLLGVIVIMPDSKMVKKVIELSSNSGELACPVFDKHGLVRWPKQQGE